MMLFPMMFTVLQRTSVFHTWPAWVAAFLFLTPESFHSWREVDLTRWLDFFHPTLGWALMLVVITTCTVVWWRTESVDFSHDRLQADQRRPVARAPHP